MVRKKRFVSLLLTFAMVLTLVPAAFAVDTTDTGAEPAAIEQVQDADDSSNLGEIPGETGAGAEEGTGEIQGDLADAGEPAEELGDLGETEGEAADEPVAPVVSGTEADEVEVSKDGEDIEAIEGTEAVEDEAEAEHENLETKPTPYANVIDGVQTVYVASASKGGSESGDGSQDNPYLRITQAIDNVDADATELDIVLLSDITLTNEIELGGNDFDILIKSEDGQKYSIKYEGTHAIGGESGVFKVTGTGVAGAGSDIDPWFTDIKSIVVFSDLTITGSTGDYDGRVVYVADGGLAGFINVTICDGKLNNATNTNQGGAGIHVADGGNVLIDSGCVLSKNQTTAGGGAIYVANGGTLVIADEEQDGIQIKSNTAGLGGGIYAEEQTGNGGVYLIGGEDSGITFTSNAATDNGGAMYIEAGANAVVSGNVTATGHKIGGAYNNIYLARGATLDIDGATATADLGITCADEYVYRLVSAEANNYDIVTTPASAMDELGWTDDCGTWDIRYLEYNGVPGLYLYYFTLEASFSDVDTLTTLEGNDIDGTEVDYLTADIPNKTNENGTLVIPGVIPVSGEDYVVVINCNEADKEYRIPTADQVSIECDGKALVEGTDYTYEPGFENGTATLTLKAEAIEGLSGTVEFNISAEKYYKLTVKCVGPLYSMATDITELTQDVLTLSRTENSGETASYSIKRGEAPAVGVTVKLYEEGTQAFAGTQTSGEDGTVTFTGLDSSKTYFPVIEYTDTYDVIGRDLASFELSTIPGQTLATTASASNGTLEYDASTGKASITGLTADSTVTFTVQQVVQGITFMGNEGESTTRPASIVLDGYTAVVDADTQKASLVKKLEDSANTYGALPTASMTGYDFGGWYTTADCTGDEVTSATAYDSQTSATVLYAKWTAREDTEYKIEHWVEVADGGANPRMGTDGSSTKTVDGVQYYLYETTYYNKDCTEAEAENSNDVWCELKAPSDGVSDTVKDISGQTLATMGSTEFTWWTRDGFETAVQAEDCKVLADGSSVFSIYYNRKDFTISYENNGCGTATPDESEELPEKEIGFGEVIGDMLEPTLPGYEFGGWYDGDQELDETDIYNRAEDTTVVAHWTTKKDTKWAIQIMAQDIGVDANGVYYTKPSYTALKKVWLDNDGNMLTGETDTELTRNISEIDELAVTGYHYVGYNDSGNAYWSSVTESADGSYKVYVKPTDLLTADEDGIHFNASFDGGMVYLYYDRNTRVVETTDGQGNETEQGEIIYGGDFTGHLPDDPGKDGYDFSGWVDPEGNPVTEETPADSYVDEDGNLDITPTWEARDYRLTYVPGAKATFVASDGGEGTHSMTVSGGYLDSHDVTYDQAMGDMPTANRPGYVFNGWKLNEGPSAGTFVTSETMVNVETVVITNKDENPPYGYENTRLLYADYTPHQYTLKLIPGQSKNGAEGSVSPDSVIVTFDAEVSGLPTPTLTGYKFVGWVLDPNDPETTVSNGDIWDRVYTNGQEIPVYALWMPESYKYTFDLNDSQGSTRGTLKDTTIDYVDVEYDSVYDGVFEVEAMRNGYNFVGWSLTRDGDALTAEDLNLINSNTTVYALWEPIEYTVTLIMHGSTITALNDPTDLVHYDPTAEYHEDTDTWTFKVKFDTTYGKLPIPVKEDCTFNGWLCTAEHWETLNGKFVAEIPSYTDWRDTEGITFEAILEPWFTFDPDGGQFEDGTTDPKKELQSDIDELPAVEKEDYVHDGWQNENGDRVTVEDLLDKTEPETLKPIYAAEVTFDANGGTVNDEPTAVLGLVEAMTELPEAIREDYEFLGWFTEAEAGDQVTLEGLKEDNVPVTVYAHWEPYFTFDPDGGKFDDDTTDPKKELQSEIEELPTVTKDDYEQDGWQDSEGNPVDVEDLKDLTEAEVLTPVWLAKVTFNANGGSVNGKSVDTLVAAKLTELPTASRSSYDFNGWYTEKSGGTQVTLAKLIEDNVPVTVYAHWTARSTSSSGGGGGGGSSSSATYEVTFDSNGGSAVPSQTTTGKVTKPTDPTKRFYEFAGWYTDEALTTAFDFSKDRVKKDTTLYAKWTYIGPAEYLTTDHIAYIVGYDDGNIHPENNISRAEVATIFYRLLKPEVREKYETTVNKYSDVDPDAWYAKAVLTLTNMGVLYGRGNNIFDPTAPITRAELAVICTRLDTDADVEGSTFTDVSADYWAAHEIGVAAVKGWVVGTGNGKFEPEAYITRAAVVTMVNRVLGRDSLTEETYKGVEGIITWPDNMDTSAWYYDAFQEATNGHDCEFGTINGNQVELWTKLTKTTMPDQK